MTSAQWSSTKHQHCFQLTFAAAPILGQRRQTLDNRVFGCLAGIAKIAKTAAAKFPTPGMSK
jgi:hypothetical protein